MTVDEQFRKMLGKMMQAHAVRTVGFGTVTDIKDNNCTVVRDGQPELYDVHFHATDMVPGSRMIEIPADGSRVIYAIIDNQDTEAVIIKCSEISRVLIKIGQTTYDVDASGHLVAKGDDNLKDALSDFISEVAKIIVINGRGPNVAALEQLKQKIGRILK